MKNNYFLVTFLSIIFSLILSACGGGGGGSENPSETTPQQGIFLDSAVIGMAYTSVSYSGKTDANGTFNYKPGEAITFSIGGITIGNATGASVLTPISLVSGATDETHPTVINITRLLLTLDDDNNPDNGISISAVLSEAANLLSLDFDKSVADFEMATDLVSAIAALKASTTLISSVDAQNHLKSSILAAFAGDYSGTFGGDDSGSYQVTAADDGTISGTGSDSAGGEFGITGVMASNGSATFTQGGTTSGATYTGTVEFNGSLSGTWMGVNNTSGTFSGSKQ